MSAKVIKINRAPVLTLWGAVVAERLGFKREEALTLGRAVAGLNPYAKDVSLGLFQPTLAASANSAGSSCAGGLRSTSCTSLCRSCARPQGCAR